MIKWYSFQDKIAKRSTSFWVYGLAFLQGSIVSNVAFDINQACVVCSWVMGNGLRSIIKTEKSTRNIFYTSNSCFLKPKWKKATQLSVKSFFWVRWEVEFQIVYLCILVYNYTCIQLFAEAKVNIHGALGE